MVIRMNRKRKNGRILFTAAAAAAIWLISGLFLSAGEKNFTAEEAVPAFAELMAVNGVKPTEEPKPDYTTLRAELESMMSGYSGDWSLYFEDNASGEQIIINNHQVYSASLIKLFVAETLYQRMYDGRLADSDNIEELIRRMITFSDNEAWKSLAKTLGGGNYMAGMHSVTETAQAEGFSLTGQFMQGDRKNFNFTCVEDCGVYLRRVLRGELISPEYSEKILSLLKHQEVLHKIPSGVPEGIETANKTGELEYLEGDAAIVYAPSGTYILVIISQDMENTGNAQLQIRELSTKVYDFLNN